MIQSKGLKSQNLLLIKKKSDLQNHDLYFSYFQYLKLDQTFIEAAENILNKTIENIDTADITSHPKSDNVDLMKMLIVHSDDNSIQEEEDSLKFFKNWHKITIKHARLKLLNF